MSLTYNQALDILHAIDGMQPGSLDVEWGELRLHVVKAPPASSQEADARAESPRDPPLRPPVSG